jgi:hypothetical protein
MGAVIDTGRSSSPARLDHARDIAPKRQLAETETAHLELPQVSTRTTTARAAILDANLELLLLGKPVD